jgi:hypothetical protein
VKYQWIELSPFPGYSVNRGKVRDRHGNTLAAHIGGDGKAYVRLRVNGLLDWYPVDVLAARAYHGAPPSRWHQVAHLNGDQGDDDAENLAWVEDIDYAPLMRGGHARSRRDAPEDYGHGRHKVASCCRRGHSLSMDTKPDDNTALHGYGNRTCRRCWPEELTDIIVKGNAGYGRY